jgi:GR25 family glycosyltransferase involved in LPS biosynthesis
MSYQILYDLDRILRYHGIFYWITGRTLLGAIKVGGLLKNSCEKGKVDICVTSTDISVLPQIGLEKCGYNIQPGNGEYKWIITRQGNQACISSYAEEILPDKILFPLRRISMQSFLVFAPANPEEYLKITHTEKKWGEKLRLDHDWKVVRRVCLNNFKHAENSGTSPLNTFFDRIFVINLHDQTTRMNSVDERLKKYDISYTRFDAVDGRYRSKEDMERKRKALEREYKVKISRDIDLKTASLTLGTYLILKEMVKNRWEKIAILEDDATLDNDFNQKFTQGIAEVNTHVSNWDILFLGCGQLCGHRGISREKTEQTPHLTTLHKFNKKAEYYVEHPEDIRYPCLPEKCTKISEHISKAYFPSGNFGYAYSLKGAKKMLKIIDGKIDEAIDAVIESAIKDGKVRAITFDPPIIYHFGGAERTDTNLDWTWNFDVE